MRLSVTKRGITPAKYSLRLAHWAGHLEKRGSLAARTQITICFGSDGKIVTLVLHCALPQVGSSRSVTICMNILEGASVSKI